MPIEFIMGSKGSGMTLYLTYMGELCPKCGKVRMLHPEAYIYTCPYCRFSYKIDPVNRKKPIEILHKSEVKKK